MENGEIKMFYDGTKLLSLKDIDGNKPEIYICTSNRNAGKTTFFARLLVKRFKKKKEKFILLYRYNYELFDCAEKFFNDIKGLFFENDIMKSKIKGKGIYSELYLNDELCGYAIALNNADQIKKFSHLFNNCTAAMFDEFQSENNNYCGNEIQKFLSVHTSIARGNNKQVRYFPVYMISNFVSLINPYYTALNIGFRLQKDTKFMRGSGWVLESGFNESAAKGIVESGFGKAFANHEYITYAAQKVYLNDNYTFIQKPETPGRYVCGIIFNGSEFHVSEHQNEGVIYVSPGLDKTHALNIAVTTADHKENAIMLNNKIVMITILRNYFNQGLCRFKDLSCKEAFFGLISYS